MLVYAESDGSTKGPTLPKERFSAGNGSFQAMLARGISKSDLSSHRAFGFSETGIFGLAHAVEAFETSASFSSKEKGITAHSMPLQNQPLQHRLNSQAIPYSVYEGRSALPQSSSSSRPRIIRQQLQMRPLNLSLLELALFGAPDEIEIAKSEIDNGPSVAKKTTWIAELFASKRHSLVRLIEGREALKVEFGIDAISDDEYHQLLDHCKMLSVKFGVTIELILIKNYKAR
jgi:hypothetical protein